MTWLDDNSHRLSYSKRRVRYRAFVVSLTPLSSWLSTSDTFATGDIISGEDEKICIKYYNNNNLENSI